MKQLKRAWRRTPTPVRRPLVLVVGVLLIIAGLAMLVLPGPGWAAIFLGLAILASEFEQAEKIRAAIVRRFKDVISKARGAPKR